MCSWPEPHWVFHSSPQNYTLCNIRFQAVYNPRQYIAIDIYINETLVPEHTFNIPLVSKELPACSPSFQRCCCRVRAWVCKPYFSSRPSWASQGALLIWGGVGVQKKKSTASPSPWKAHCTSPPRQWLTHSRVAGVRDGQMGRSNILQYSSSDRALQGLLGFWDEWVRNQTVQNHQQQQLVV